MRIIAPINHDHPRPAFTLKSRRGQSVRRHATRNPFVFASPHSGRFYPERLQTLTPLSERTLRRSEDAYVDTLFESVTDLGIPFLMANYPRVYVDLNRSALELDPRMFRDQIPTEAETDNERVTAGFGVIPRMVTASRPIYSRKLNYRAERRRLSDIYAPYHAQLAQLLGRAKMYCGWAVLIDCHSMPSMKAPPSLRFGGKFLKESIFPKEPDIVLGDRFGRSCAPRLLTTVERLFQSKGYHVARNEPYAGGYCTAHYGDPENGVHALQVEINRRLYMDEEKVTPRDDDVAKLREDLKAITTELIKLDLRTPQHIAAE